MSTTTILHHLSDFSSVLSKLAPLVGPSQARTILLKWLRENELSAVAGRFASSGPQALRFMGYVNTPAERFDYPLPARFWNADFGFDGETDRRLSRGLQETVWADWAQGNFSWQLTTPDNLSRCSASAVRLNAGEASKLMLGFAAFCGRPGSQPPSYRPNEDEIVAKLRELKSSGLGRDRAISYLRKQPQFATVKFDDARRYWSDNEIAPPGRPKKSAD